MNLEVPYPFTPANTPLGAVSFSDGRNDLPTAIRGPPPPRVAHSTPLGLLYLGTHAFFCRAAGSVVAPGLVVSPRPPGACSEGVCMGLGGFPVPRRKMHRRGAFSKVCERVPQSTASVESICCCSADLSYRRPKQIDGLGPVESKNRSPRTGAPWSPPAVARVCCFRPTPRPVLSTRD